MSTSEKYTNEDWEVKAAFEIDDILGRAVIRNTGIETGFFCGVSMVDIARIIRENYIKSKG